MLIFCTFLPPLLVFLDFFALLHLFSDFFESFQKSFQTVWKLCWKLSTNFPETSENSAFYHGFSIFPQMFFQFSCGNNKKKSDFFQSFKKVFPPTAACGFSTFRRLWRFLPPRFWKAETFPENFKAFSNEFFHFSSCILKFRLHKSFEIFERIYNIKKKTVQQMFGKKRCSIKFGSFQSFPQTLLLLLLTFSLIIFLYILFYLL